MFDRYIFLAIANVILMVINALGSPLIALFISRSGYLPWWLSWFQTDDNPATGDDMFKRNQMAWTLNLWPWWARYFQGIFWAIRNPAYGFSSRYGMPVFNAHSCTESGTPNIDIGRDEVTGAAVYTLGHVYRTAINGDGVKFFEFKAAGRWTANYAWMVQFGWNLAPVLRNGEVRNLYVGVRPRVSIANK